MLEKKLDKLQKAISPVILFEWVEESIRTYPSVSQGAPERSYASHLSQFLDLKYDVYRVNRITSQLRLMSESCSNAE